MSSVFPIAPLFKMEGKNLLPEEANSFLYKYAMGKEYLHILVMSIEYVFSLYTCMCVLCVIDADDLWICFLPNLPVEFLK